MTTSRKDRLLARTLAETTVRVRVAPFGELDDALATLDVARSGDAPDPDEIGQAQAAVDACYEEITFRALPTARHDELISEHPPPEDKRDTHAFDPDTFVPAVVGESCTDDELDEKFWAEFFATAATAQEKQTVYLAVEALHRRSLDVRVGKGSTPTRS